jgi:hypothetical protein
MLAFYHFSVSLLANSSLFLARYLVYNLRKRGGGSADKYFKSTELIAGVKDMRFQALMPDIFHWLGIKKVDKVVSMSDMKYDAIVNVKRGIEIWKRYDIPGEYLHIWQVVFLHLFFNAVRYSLCAPNGPFADHLIPPDSRVEIGAKIAAG